MSKKATHYGTCQWCSSVQKLPNGLLAKHGYTVAGGWFRGTCHGSSALPYELSKNLIDDSIAWARHRIEDVNAKIDAVLAIDTAATNKAWVHVYHPEMSTRKRGSVYVWEEHELTPFGGSVHAFAWDDASGRQHVIRDFGPLPDQIATLNGRYVEHLRHQVREIESYIARQERRIKDWKPQPLTPISQ